MLIMSDTDKMKGKIFCGKKLFKSLCEKAGASNTTMSFIFDKIEFILSNKLADFDVVTSDPELVEILKAFEEKS